MTKIDPETMAALRTVALQKREADAGYTAQIKRARISTRRRGPVTRTAVLTVIVTTPDRSRRFARVVFARERDGRWCWSVTVAAFRELEALGNACDEVLDIIDDLRCERFEDAEGAEGPPRYQRMPEREGRGGRNDG